MVKKKQRAARNYPPIKPSGFNPIPSVEEIKDLFPPEVRTKGTFLLCTVEAYTKKGYHLESDDLFGNDAAIKEILCNSIIQLREIATASPELGVTVAGFLGDHLQPITHLTGKVAQLIK